MNFWPQFIRLKTAVGGNREQLHYEETFGQPMEEQQHITPVPAHIRRCLSQLEFAIRLAALEKGLDDAVAASLEHLTACMDRDGTLTKRECLRAEELLLPCAGAAKEYRLILAGHAHIDMDWMWSYHETVALTLSTFRTVLNLMEEYPQFCFSQSQASVYRMVEEYDPHMMQEIKKRIREGRWEVTASAWVETDKNMPNTESLLRHIQYTKEYLRDTWGLDPDSLEIDFSPDTFGHSAHIPELDNFGGVKYMYHCRALDGDQSLYRWRAPSGKELLCYREQYWYNSGITPRIGLGLMDIAATCGGLKTGLIVYGVGNHGGGPTRRDIETALDMQTWPVWPRVTFGTLREFFHEAETVRQQLPLIDRELNYIFAGCYTTQTRIKQANRKAEALMRDSETWMAFAGRRLPERHKGAWENILYAHFHDIITGSCVPDTRENAMGQFQKAFAYGQTQYRSAVEAIAAAIDTSSIQVDTDIARTQSEGAGGAYGMGPNVGIGRPAGVDFNIGFQHGIPNPERGCGKTRIFHLFNSVGRRTVVAELTLWDWVGDLRRLQVKDAKGNLLRHQLMDTAPQWYWDHKFLRLLVQAQVPPMGYTTVVVSEAEATEYPVYRQPRERSEYPFDDIILENEHLRAVFHRATGRLISLADKASGKEHIAPGSGAGLAVVTMESRTNNAWKIGRYLKTEDLTQPQSIVSLTEGVLHNSFTASYRWGQSSFKVTPSLRAGDRELHFCLEAQWNEITGPETTPLLLFRMPHTADGEQYLCDVPAGAVRRSPRNQDIPCLRYCAAVYRDGSALALMPDSKYGYRAEKDCLSLSLINTSCNPDPFPDRGLHTVNVAVAVSREDTKLLEDTAARCSHPVYVLSANAHRGSAPMERSFLDFAGRSTVLSAVMPTQEAGCVDIRYYETAGREDALTLTLPAAPKKAETVDLMGNPVPSDLHLQGNTLTVTARPASLGQIRVWL